jgi:asparagine synthase (glutamine-hydrolysing)
MCGINAIIKGNDDVNFELTSMNEATKRRGFETFYEDHGSAQVAFNWLPITDKLNYPPNEYNGTVVYLNGFISNYKELATKYDIALKTNSDIEFLAKFLDLHNGNKLDELNGFFAVLYWSPFYKDWFRFTDRYGIKQLYEYRDEKGTTYISSEVKGILAVCPEIELDENAIEDWKCTLGAMNENTIYKGIRRIPKLPFVVPKKISISYEDAKIKLQRLLLKSFQRNNYNGAKGVYLSGGIDSGIIAKWLIPEYCFSVDYVDNEFSEAELIKENSIRNHYSIIINEHTAKKYAFKTMEALDDLKAGSCYTNFAIAELASKFVKVVYSGAGGDEFFGGYPHRKNVNVPIIAKRTINQECWGYVDKLQRTKTTPFEYDLKFLSAVLVVEDRMSGFHTMETRYPLLDNDLVDFALSLPDEYLENKRILKDVSGLSEKVLNGKKRGFSNPYFTNDEWVEFTLKNLKR